MKRSQRYAIVTITFASMLVLPSSGWSAEPEGKMLFDNNQARERSPRDTRADKAVPMPEEPDPGERQGSTGKMLSDDGKPGEFHELARGRPDEPGKLPEEPKQK